MSSKLFKDELLVKTKPFPLLDNISKFSKKKIYTNLFFNFDIDREVEKKVSSFFKESSLKTALKKHFGINSPTVTTFINTKLLKESKTRIDLNLNYYLSLLALSEVFIKQPNPNFNDFSLALENQTIQSLLAPHYLRIQQIKHFLNSNFTESQKLKILTNSDYNSEIPDLIAMFLQNDKFMIEALAKEPWSEKDSLRKCHDLLSGYNQQLNQKDFKLFQEKYHKRLSEVSQLDIKGNYKIQIPQTHHDLILWGTKLGHCIGSKHYADAAAQGKCVLLGLINSENSIKFTLEIRNKSLTQIQGVSNTRPNQQTMQSLVASLKSLNLLK